MRAADRTAFGTAATLSALAGVVPAASDTYDCVLFQADSTIQLLFTVDPASFAPALDPGDPPRRQISRVTQDGTTFDADSVLTEDGTLGFWSQDRRMMLTRAPQGAARLTFGNRGPWTGRCEEIS